MEEIWREIPNTSGFYEVSNKGRVRSWQTTSHKKIRSDNPLIMKLNTKKRDGSVNITLVTNDGSKNLLVHRLVASAFIDNPNDKPEVNHIDGDRENNCVDNLEWVTRQENMDHAYKTGILNNTGENNPNSKVSRKEVIEIRRLRKCGLELKDIAKRYGISIQAVSEICLGNNFSHVKEGLEDG